jgi:signal transduction histidine kinase
VTIYSETIAPDLRIFVPGSELQHALINLLLNAVQACSTGGVVRVDAECGGAEVMTVVIRIRDTGCGIPPEVRARIFEPFFSGRTDGTGLGLFLSLNFVRGSGGDILVDSTPGQGSTFSVVLPAFGSTCVPDVGEAAGA